MAKHKALMGSAVKGLTSSHNRSIALQWTCHLLQCRYHRTELPGSEGWRVFFLRLTQASMSRSISIACQWQMTHTHTCISWLYITYMHTTVSQHEHRTF